MSNFCQTCGGQTDRIGNYFVCEYCGNKWEIDSANDVHAVERAGAWSALRDGDFEKASELFDNILLKDSKSHEAYWGRALALGGIVYVTDMNENKKVPTCNNITEESFLQHKDVQKAISLAPRDIAEGYKTQADYIERVRTEWLEKASKEPAYDVFISFKDSDRENGIERTQDSIDAQDLYNALVAEGYKVFFSRISLRDKIAEQYEPYIYNAIKTAKVMIVFGEKPEYFSSVWIKNEWSRFKARIEKGEKHKNSLVVVYKNMNPGDLPVVLKSRQCMNMADMTFLSDLNRHIKRVVEETKRNVHLDKIEIAGGQIAKKAAALNVNSVQTREIGQGAIAETSISEKQSISLIHTFLEEKQWQDAKNLAEDVLFNNPTCAEAVWCAMLANHKALNKDQLIQKLNKFSKEDYGTLEKVLNCASKEFAQDILTSMYHATNAEDAPYKRLLQTILPFSFPDRQKCIDQAFAHTIEKSKYQSFQLLLTTLQSDDVDAYIQYNYRYAGKTTNTQHKKECLKNVLSVDEGHVDTLRSILMLDLSKNRPVDGLTADLETLLKYTDSADREVERVLQWLQKNLESREQCRFTQQVLRYYTSEIAQLKSKLVGLGFRVLEKGFFQESEYFWNLLLSVDQNCPDAYWGICLMKIGAKNEAAIQEKNKLLRDLPEFNKYLTFVDDTRRRKCIELSKKQIAAYMERRNALENERKNLQTSLAQKNSGCIPISLICACVFWPIAIWGFSEGSTFFPSILAIGGVACIVGFVSSCKGARNKRQENAQARERIRQIEQQLEQLPPVQ